MISIFLFIIEFHKIEVQIIMEALYFFLSKSFHDSFFEKNKIKLKTIFFFFLNENFCTHKHIIAFNHYADNGCWQKRHFFQNPLEAAKILTYTGFDLLKTNQNNVCQVFYQKSIAIYKRVTDWSYLNLSQFLDRGGETISLQLKSLH